MTTHYETLELAKDANGNSIHSSEVTILQIKSAYRRLAMQYHPDKNKGDDTRFKEIQNAYETLVDPSKRRIYDYDLSRNKSQEPNQRSYYQEQEREQAQAREQKHPPRPSQPENVSSEIYDSKTFNDLGVMFDRLYVQLRVVEKWDDTNFFSFVHVILELFKEDSEDRKARLQEYTQNGYALINFWLHGFQGKELTSDVTKTAIEDFELFYKKACYQSKNDADRVLTDYLKSSGELTNTTGFSIKIVSGGSLQLDKVPLSMLAPDVTKLIVLHRNVDLRLHDVKHIFAGKQLNQNIPIGLYGLAGETRTHFLITSKKLLKESEQKSSGLTPPSLPTTDKSVVLATQAKTAEVMQGNVQESAPKVLKESEQKRGGLTPPLVPTTDKRVVLTTSPKTVDVVQQGGTLVAQGSTLVPLQQIPGLVRKYCDEKNFGRAFIFLYFDAACNNSAISKKFIINFAKNVEEGKIDVSWHKRKDALAFAKFYSEQLAEQKPALDIETLLSRVPDSIKDRVKTSIVNALTDLGVSSEVAEKKYAEYQTKSRRLTITDTSASASSSSASTAVVSYASSSSVSHLSSVERDKESRRASTKRGSLVSPKTISSNGNKNIGTDNSTAQLSQTEADANKKKHVLK